MPLLNLNSGLIPSCLSCLKKSSQEDEKDYISIVKNGNTMQFAPINHQRLHTEEKHKTKERNEPKQNPRRMKMNKMSEQFVINTKTYTSTNYAQYNSTEHSPSRPGSD